MSPQRRQSHDPRLRRLVVGATALAVVLGIGVWFWGLPTLRRQLPYPPPPHTLETVKALAVAACAPLLALGIHLLHTGARVLKARRFPPPGMRLPVDTDIRDGGAASPVAVTLFVSGAVLLLLALGLMLAAPGSVEHWALR